MLRIFVIRPAHVRRVTSVYSVELLVPGMFGVEAATEAIVCWPADACTGSLSVA